MPEWGECPEDALLLGILLFPARMRELCGSLIMTWGQHSAT